MFSVTRPLGRGCDGTGRFWVRQVVVSGSTVQKLAIDFDQHCQGSDPGLYGALRYNSDISSLIPFDGDYPRYRLDISATVNGVVRHLMASALSGSGQRASPDNRVRPEQPVR